MDVTDAHALAGFIDDLRPAVLTGAGMSTASGIPDYRGVSRRPRRPRSPILHQEFMRDAAVRQRYWARSHVGWRLIADAAPNPAHHALARLQRSGHVGTVISQNVDGLDRRAGVTAVVELHGRLADVGCSGCGRTVSRAVLDRRLRDRNPRFVAEAAAAAPDGDADLPEALVRTFEVAACEHCGGVLKPDVVFFGGSVPAARVAAATAAVDGAAGLLVLGSSLSVYSGYRFVRRAGRHAKPVAVVTRGSTRADDEVRLKIDRDLATFLPEVVDLLAAPALGATRG